MSMYSSARFSSHKRVRAVFIGRRLMIMTALFVVLSVVTFSLGAVAAKRLKTAGAAFNKFMISEQYRLSLRQRPRQTAEFVRR